jgi:hypothetical protein
LSLTDDAAANPLLSRKSRCNYGIIYKDHYDPKVHSEGEGTVDVLRGEMMVDNCIEWIVRRGEDISTCAKVFPLNLMLPGELEGVQPFDFEIYKSTSKNPAGRYDPEDPDIEPVAKITIRTPVAVEDLPRARDKFGDWQPNFDYELRVEVDGESIAAKAFYGKNEEIGSLRLAEL